MKIRVSVKQLKEQIDKAIEEYDVEYKKLLKVYLEKLEKYNSYVKTVIESGKIEPLKYAPSHPSYLRNTFVDIHSALHAHTEEYIVMEDMEYRNILHGIENMRVTTTESINNLRALGYE